MKQHLSIVAALYIGFGFLKILAAGIALVAIVGGGLVSGDPDAIAITGIIGPALAFFLFLTALPGILGGYGLLKGWAWARILVLILALFDLIQFPIGTVVAVYTMWVLLNSESNQLFDTGSAKSQMAYS
jgi:hypothetical protein